MKLQISKALSVEEIEPDDAEGIYAIIDRSREHLRTYLPWVDFNQSARDVADFIAASKQLQAIKNGGNYVIRYEGEIAGVIGLHHIDWSNHHTSIGYWLAGEMQGQGIMTAAVSGLVAYVFDELGLNRVEIRCATDNKKSRAIPERLGFTWEGRIREGEWIYDHYVDHEVYGLLKKEWQKH
ncbi:GNAT family N-acetyltransferase [Aneurinibacillus tyrosinisolvens]|uniref:GNAT family N-acetyltransferase n=1 Tax=Aneurinibacillus tyrosinisolvens TaxID=1443435 RepID=UPI00063F0D53|nr:GNAT family protein [Aneurinibacillus tyrosinisolvens]